MVDGAGSSISEKGLDIRASAPTGVPLVKCQCSPSTPLLHPTRTPSPTQPLSHKPVPSLLLLQTPIKQFQPNQILAPLQPVAFPIISTLPEEDEPEPEEQELEQEQQEPEPEQKDPEPEQQPELLLQGVPRNLYKADVTPDSTKLCHILNL